MGLLFWPSTNLSPFDSVGNDRLLKLNESSTKHSMSMLEEMASGDLIGGMGGLGQSVEGAGNAAYTTRKPVLSLLGYQ